jgi:hypothetical protein
VEVHHGYTQSNLILLPKKDSPQGRKRAHWNYVQDFTTGDSQRTGKRMLLVEVTA